MNPVNGGGHGNKRIYSVCTMLIETEREKQIEIGVTYPYPPLGPGECYIPNANKEQLEVEIGDEITLNVQSADMMNGWIF